MSRSVLALLIVFAIACASATGPPRNPAFDKFPPGISGHTSLIYYDVHGSTFAEVFADLGREGSKRFGSTYVGETRSPMRWQWRLDQTGISYCTIREVMITVNSEITLPRWTAPEDAEPGLADEWKRFIGALEIHEAGHKDISARAAREIVRKLNGMTESCASIGFRANEVARSIVDRASQEQRDYDTATRHGMTQGTSFGRRRSSGS